MTQTQTDKIRAALERACIWDVEGALYYREALSELDGCVIVPVKPTEIQVNKGHEQYMKDNGIYWERNVYRAMLQPYTKGE